MLPVLPELRVDLAVYIILVLMCMAVMLVQALKQDSTPMKLRRIVWFMAGAAVAILGGFVTAVFFTYRLMLP